MGKIKVIQYRSIIGRPEDQKLTIEALGLGRPNWVRVHNDTPQIRGMIKKVNHLVKVEDYNEEAAKAEETKTVKKIVKKTVKKSTKTKAAGKKVASKKKKPASKTVRKKSASK
jgi:large subunit ribosomal protein L30